MDDDGNLVIDLAIGAGIWTVVTGVIMLIALPITSAATKEDDQVLNNRANGNKELLQIYREANKAQSDVKVGYAAAGIVGITGAIGVTLATLAVINRSNQTPRPMSQDETMSEFENPLRRRN